MAGSRDYTKLFIGNKVPQDSPDGWIQDSLLQIQRFVNDTGRSAGVHSNINVPLATDASNTNLAGELIQWDYSQIISKSTSAVLMTLRDPGIYLTTSRVVFTSPSTVTFGIVGTSTAGTVANLLQASEVNLGITNLFVESVSTMQVTGTPVSLGLQAFVSPGSTGGTAQLLSWAVSRLFPIPSNRG